MNSLPPSPPRSVERLDHGILHARVDVARSQTLAQPEHALNDAELRRRRVETRHRHPVVDHHAGADDVASAVHTARDERHLEQTAELVLVLYRRLGVHEAALVRERHVRADEHIVGNGLPEDLDAEHVGDDLLRALLSAVSGSRPGGCCAGAAVLGRSCW
ncbi:hypothetical protein HYQ46_008394 [Verticillium longisporum]|nr:hypothetical protein HYQ46_008394 [Verticillium longisporum]